MEEDALGLARQLGSDARETCAKCGRPVGRGEATTLASEGPRVHRFVEGELCAACRDDLARGDVDLREPIDEP